MLIMGRIRQQDMTHSADFGNSVIHCHADTGQEKYLNDPLFAGRLNQIIAGADKCMIHFIPRAKIFTAPENRRAGKPAARQDEFRIAVAYLPRSIRCMVKLCSRRQATVRASPHAACYQ
jgi:hypothetical protein